MVLVVVFGSRKRTGPIPVLGLIWTLFVYNAKLKLDVAIILDIYLSYDNLEDKFDRRE